MSISVTLYLYFFKKTYIIVKFHVQQLQKSALSHRIIKKKHLNVILGTVSKVYFFVTVNFFWYRLTKLFKLGLEKNVRLG